jgi:hypothetical protein
MAFPPLKPPVRAQRVRALQGRGDRSALTSQAIEALFESAEIIAEGGLEGDPVRAWYGSIMITFHLDRFRARCRGLDAAEDIDRVVDAICGSVRVRVRAHRIACAQVYERHPDRQVGTAHLESRWRRERDLLLLDIDLEAPIEGATSSRRSAT